ncbi:MAG: phosphoribosylformylglycinamidine synthase subunit PurS [candidate division Zixibacteria bacterium]|nr:phosphoribosylformylglycinamidine synthase subunit PurS [candidate division Zixibacteria bacterium]
MTARVYVSLKTGLADPQGQTIKQALNEIGYEDIDEVRVGKFFDIHLKTDDKDEVRRILSEISEKILANPVIENFTVGEIS